MTIASLLCILESCTYFSYTESMYGTYRYTFLLAGIVDSLVDSAADKSEVTRRAVFKALVDIGRKKYTTVLKLCHSYLKKHGKVRQLWIS